MQILIAEDDPVSRKILETSFKKWGYDVVVACDGLEALDMVEKHTPSFAILDWMMPGADGIDVCRRIREIASDKYTYVILLTARGTNEDMTMGLEAGADDYVIKPFDPNELKFRFRVGERILALQDHLIKQLYQISSANEKMKDDLVAASKIQKSMLPQNLPENKHVKIDFEIIPCEEVGGDMLNVFQLDDNHMGIWVFDVAGHGVAAAMYAVMLGRFLSHSNYGTSQIKRVTNIAPYYELVSPSDVVSYLNKQFCIDNKDKDSIFTTLIYGILDTERNVFSYVNAGHPKPLLMRENDCVIIPCEGNLPIGIMENTEYTLNETHLIAGDKLFFYTDGIFESMDSSNTPFGMKRMISFLETQKQIPMSQSLKSLVESVIEWGKDSIKKDDITMLGIEIV
jgi:phosphoserine phosphatase RsbU/P